jgi:hypothetical protein
MLPESEQGKQSYLEIHDYRSRWRQDKMQTLKGDLDEFTVYFLREFAKDAETVEMRESLDFAIQEGSILTTEMISAAENCIAWGVELRRLIREVFPKAVA